MKEEQQAVSIDCFRCTNCGNVTFSLKVVCPRCGGNDIGVTQYQGEGKVLDFAVVYYPPDNLKDRAPYTNVLVELANGCKIFGMMDGEVKDMLPGSLVVPAKYDKNTGELVFQLMKPTTTDGINADSQK